MINGEQTSQDSIAAVEATLKDKSSKIVVENTRAKEEKKICTGQYTERGPK